MEHDAFSDKSERETHDDWDTTANDNGGRLTEESDIEQPDEMPPAPQPTAYVEQNTEEMAEVKQTLDRFVIKFILSIYTKSLYCPLICK